MYLFALYYSTIDFNLITKMLDFKLRLCVNVVDYPYVKRKQQFHSYSMRPNV